MKVSQEILKQANIVPRLRLGVKAISRSKGGKMVPMVKSLGAFHVKLIKDKEVVGRDNQTGEPVPMVRYLLDVLMPDGKTWEKRIYDTRKFNKDTGEVSYLVQRMAELPEGHEVILEMKRKGIRNYVEVRDPHAIDTVEADEGEAVIE